MIAEKTLRWFAAVVICSLLLAAGCAPTEEPRITEVKPGKPLPAGAEVVTLALKFTPGDSTAYKVMTEGKKSLEFEGSYAKETSLKGGQTRMKVEMTFTQQIQSVDAGGGAVAKITIDELKYFDKGRDGILVDFDSSRETDKRNPLAKLIGQSYTIKITPASQVAQVIDAARARAAVRGRTLAAQRASALVKSDVIKQRHTIAALPAADKNRLGAGDEWSSIRNFSFGMMGAKSYERIYMLKEVKETGGRKIAVVEMNAIPTSEMADELYKEQAANEFLEMFDNFETYTGELKLNLTSGKVEKYVEKLESEWVMIDPLAREGDVKEPAALTMSASRLYSLERID
ncbi:MAG: hypothetical protein ACYS83_08705 [Planctomycetota bacterium]